MSEACDCVHTHEFCLQMNNAYVAGTCLVDNDAVFSVACLPKFCGLDCSKSGGFRS